MRNKDFKKKRRKTKPSEENSQPKTDKPKETPRINAFDYKAWDKFDVVKTFFPKLQFTTNESTHTF